MNEGSGVGLTFLVINVDTEDGSGIIRNLTRGSGYSSARLGTGRSLHPDAFQGHPKKDG